MKSQYELLIELLNTQPQTSTFAGSGYPTYSNQPVKLPSVKQASKAVKDYGLAQKDYLTSTQFPTDVISQNVGIGLGAAAGTPFGLTGPGAIAGGALGGFVGNKLKEQQGYPQTAWSTLLDTITGGIPGNLDNVASARFGLMPKGTPPKKPFNIDPSHILNKGPDLNLKKDIPITDIHGNKAVIPQGEALSVFKLKGGKVLLKDGEEYIVNKNQYANVHGNSIKGEAVEFAPELKQVQESIKSEGTRLGTLPDYARATGQTVEEARPNWERTYKENTKFSKYQLPGGKNYKEILLKAPQPLPTGHSVNSEAFTDFDGTTKPIYFVNGPDGQPTGIGQFTEQDAIQHFYKYNIPNSPNFKSSHWDEPNVLAHLRMNQREYQGKPVSFLEELQSDWASKGRREGFANPLGRVEQDEFNSLLQRWQNYESRPKMTEAELARFNILRDQNATVTGGGVPNHPLLKQWPELSLKRALQESVNNNSDYFAWTTGEQQAGRYNLSKQVDRIGWNPFDNLGAGTKVITVEPRGSNKITLFVDPSGKILPSHVAHNVPSDWIGKNLDEAIGKGVADNILKNPQGKLSGEGLNIGGEWAKNLYDNQVKSTVEKLTGGMVEPLDLGLDKNQLSKWFLNNDAPNARDFPELTTDNLKPGAWINQAGQERNSGWIVTDVLGNNQFKAVPLDTWRNWKNIEEPLGTDPEDYINIHKEFYDLSSPTKPQSKPQQGIHLTPELKAKIKGELPFNFKSPTNSFPNAFSSIPSDERSTHPILKMLGF